MTSRSDSESQSSDSDDMPLKFSCTKQSEKCESNSPNKSINSRVPNTRSSSQSGDNCLYFIYISIGFISNIGV